MKAIVVGLFLCFAGIAAAQYTDGYVFLAPGWQSSGGVDTRNYGIGGGIERMLGHGLGVGAEVAGAIAGKGKASTSLGVTSFDGYYHVLHKKVDFPKYRKADFFLTGGYALLFNNFTANGFNLGAGLNYGIGRRHAIRLEFRAQHATLPSLPDSTWLHSVRMGFTFGPRR